MGEAVRLLLLVGEKVDGGASGGEAVVGEAAKVGEAEGEAVVNVGAAVVGEEVGACVPSSVVDVEVMVP